MLLYTGLSLKCKTSHNFMIYSYSHSYNNVSSVIMIAFVQLAKKT